MSTPELPPPSLPIGPMSVVHRVSDIGDSTPPSAVPGTGHAARRRKPPRLTPEQYRVLQAVADGRINRGYLFGDLEPHLLDDRDVIWTLRRLVLHRLVLLRPVGPPSLTARGRWVLDAPN
jgi:hypothetical protein